jgi:antitoxin component of MazEF toxin-antitoxin module
MPLIKKLIPVGKISRGVILPKSWLEYAEQKEGKRISAVEVEVNGHLVLSPVFEKELKDDVPQPPSTEHINLANQPVKEVCVDV